jgi:hypothetical protein
VTSWQRVQVYGWNKCSSWKWSGQVLSAEHNFTTCYTDFFKTWRPLSLKQHSTLRLSAQCLMAWTIGTKRSVREVTTRLSIVYRSKMRGF